MGTGVQSLDIGAAPQRPVMTCHVGVSGHRALPHADVAALQAAAGTLFRTIRETVLNLHQADQASREPVYRATPPILRCICGIAEGADGILAQAALDQGWTLAASLPFPREEFARDFAPGTPLDRYRALLAQAAQVCELDGDRPRGGEPYAQVGQQIVEQSDIMLVIWDGLPPRGPGGTGDVVGSALDLGLAVAVLPPVGPVSVTWQGAPAGDLRQIVQNVVLPPGEAVDGVRAYLRDTPRAGGWAAAFVRGYERVVLLGTRTRPSAPPTADVPPPDAIAGLSGHFASADRLAGEYAARYRAAGLMRFGLILPATLGAFVGSFATPALRPAGHLLQFASLVAVVLFSARGGWERAQGRFLSYRTLAEYLRNACLLLPLGAVPRAPGSAVHEVHAGDWTGWFGRCVVREAGLRSAVMDQPAVTAAAAHIRAETTGQLAYLLGRAERFAAIARRLRWIGLALFACGIGFEGARVLLAFVQAGERTVLWFNELALLLPAMAPVFLGLRSFGEYDRLAIRYRAVAAELQTQLASLDRAGPRHDAVLHVGRRIAAVMLAESADWQLLIKARTVSAT